MKRLISTVVPAVLIIALAAHASVAAFETTVPISAELATSIATSLFPQTVPLSENSLYVSNPVVLYASPGPATNPSPGAPRLRLQLNVQSLRHSNDHQL